jgi:plasmid stabilization system protein ParE
VTGALHVTNGDCVEEVLRETGLAREVLSWRDVLHEGPVPAVDPGELRRIRAAFLAGAGAADMGALDDLTERDRTLEAHRDGEYVLWFEADLYDQLQVVQILATLAELGVAPARITLICIGEYPGIAHFGGLAELTPDQLRGLPAAAATPLTAAGLQAATRAWAALRATEPTALGAVATRPSSQLRFVAEAFDRISREYPSTRDGLALTERRILAAVAGGAPSAGDAFVRTGAREARPFLGDTWSFDTMQRLAQAPTPLLEAEPAGTRVDRDTRLRLTAAGRRVLDGEHDHVALNGVDRWIGGVHLQGDDVHWRWHDGEEAIIAWSTRPVLRA